MAKNALMSNINSSFISWKKQNVKNKLGKKVSDLNFPAFSNFLLSCLNLLSFVDTKSPGGGGT